MLKKGLILGAVVLIAFANKGQVNNANMGKLIKEQECIKASEKIIEMFKKIKHIDVKLEGVKAIPNTNLCLFLLKFPNGQYLMPMITTDGRYLFFGERGYILATDLKEKKNLSQELFEKIENVKSVKVPPKVLKELDKYVVFTIGKKESPNKVIFIADPLCNMCRKAYITIKGLALKGEIYAKVIYVPFTSQKEDIAKIICNGLREKALIMKPEEIKKLPICEFGLTYANNVYSIVANRLKVASVPAIIYNDELLVKFLKKEN